MPTRIQRRLGAVPVAVVLAAGFAALPTATAAPTSVDTRGATSEGSTSAASTSAPAGVLSERRAVPAQSFVNSVGVGVHLHEGSGSAYTNFSRVKQALLNLGVHHVRDSLSGNPAEYLALGKAGIKVSGTVPRTAYSDATQRKVINLAEKLRPALSSIGGPNEFETTVSNWAVKLRSFQSRLFAKVNADPAIRDIPVLGPALRVGSNERLLGNISQFMDMGSIHAYPYGHMPEEKAAAYVANARITSGSKPIVVSETGMANASDALRKKYNLPFSERAAAIYMPRLVLEYFRLGVVRTYIYQLLNEDHVGHLSPREWYYGLLNKNFSPKPDYYPMRNLLHVLADGGRQFTPRSLSYTISSSGTLRKMLFQKADGSYYIAVWRPVSVWQPGARNGHDLFPGSVSATLNLPSKASSVQVFDIQRGMTPISTARNTAHVQFKAQASVELVKVTM